MTVHFVCRGNAYRSRLAETYLNSKQLPNIKAISSGIGAENNISGPITWYAQRIIQKEHLVSFEKPNWQKTTKDLFEEGDYTIFMQKEIYDFCINNLGFKSNKYEIWDIHDLEKEVKGEMRRIKATEKTHEEIKKKVDELITKIHIYGKS